MRQHNSSNSTPSWRAAFGTSVITPSNRLYVRNNLPAPDAAILDSRDAWTVSIEGVKNPRTLTLAELRTLGVETVATVLQCSGNGRGFFPSKPSGTPWSVGAAGCVVVGDPAYYGRFGFLNDPDLRYGEASPYLQRLVLQGRPPSGAVRYPAAFDA